MAERLHIVDGYGYIFRAYYGLAGPGVSLSTADGLPTGALYVYAQMLVRLHLDVAPDRIVVVFDAPGKNFRSELSAEYKANRKDPPEDLVPQFPHFRPLTEAFAWPVVAVSGVEADDVIATLTKQARAQGMDVTIFSADKDLMQLVDEHVTVIDSMRQKTYDAAAVEEKFGVGPKLVGDWLALVGDASDNIKGMPGVGKKTATKLLLEHGSIDGILANTDSLKGKMKERFEDPEMLAGLELSRTLVALKLDVELPAPVESFKPQPWDGQALADTLRRYEFHALLERLDPGAGKEVAQPVVTLPDSALAIADYQELEALLDAAEAKNKLALAGTSDGARSDRERLVGLALAAPDTAPLYLPLRHRYLGCPKQLELGAMPDRLRNMLEGSVELCVHEAKSLRRMLRREGLTLGPIGTETMLAAYLADATSDNFSIESVAKSLIGAELETYKSLCGTGKKAQLFESIPVEAAANFAGRRAQATLAMSDVLTRRVNNAGAGPLLREVEQPLATLLADIEDVGITIDTAYLAKLGDRVAKDISALEAKAHELAGEAFNLGSPKQLSTLLFGKLGLPHGKKTKSGAYSTDHEVLEGLRHDHPIVDAILQHRELSKLKGTYIDALPPLVHPETGRLHTSFRQAVAATGRLSSQDPNLQNIPIRTELGREIRRAFVAAEGMTLVSADYSQIELRVMAHLSGDPVLRKAFQNGIDVHTQTAAEVFDIPLEQVGSAERRVAKAVNYGLIYGQSAFGLAKALDIPQSEAKRYIERYFERFAAVRTFMDDLVKRARRAGAAETVLGRKRAIPNLTSKNFRLRSAAERVAQNTPMQGSAADIMKLAMLKAADVAKAQPYPVRFLLTVHDELVFEVSPEHAQGFATLIGGEMERAYELEVPLVVDTGVANNWADAH